MILIQTLMEEINSVVYKNTVFENRDKVYKKKYFFLELSDDDEYDTNIRAVVFFIEILHHGSEYLQ